MPFHQNIFASAQDMYASGEGKRQFLKNLIDGFSKFFAEFESCIAQCEDAISKNEEYEENDGDLASNLGKLE